nr:thioesterase family protein [Georgfuchsia toluolica]
MQSGHALSPLLCALIEDVPTLAPMLSTRFVLNLTRPVPMVPMQWRTAILHEGKRLQILRATLIHEKREVADMTVVRIRISKSPTPVPLRSYPGPEQSQAVPRSHLPRSFELRSVPGSERPGGIAVWMRMGADLFPGQPASPLAHAMCLCDFGSSLCGPLDRSKWIYPNFDLTMHVFREPVGEWLLLDADIETAGLGMALVSGILADQQGAFGRAHQSIIITPVAGT